MSADYVLGTDEVELRRLGAQHDVWRAAAHAAWQRALIGAGSTVLDLGCGPGFAAADLAAVVGSTGHVIALDKAPRYLEATRARGVEARACDLDDDSMLPVAPGSIDAVWARWVFCFLTRPRALLARVAEALKPGGVFVAHEYFDYSTWRAAPRVPEVEEFVAAVMASWRAQGGEPDIALSLLPWLGELGFEIVSARPITHVAAPGDAMFSWVSSFGRTGLDRLVELGHVSRDRAPAIAQAWASISTVPHVRIVTPSVLELVARKR